VGRSAGNSPPRVCSPVQENSYARDKRQPMLDQHQVPVMNDPNRSPPLVLIFVLKSRKRSCMLSAICPSNLDEVYPNPPVTSGHPERVPPPGRRFCLCAKPPWPQPRSQKRKAAPAVQTTFSELPAGQICIPTSVNFFNDFQQLFRNVRAHDLVALISLLQNFSCHSPASAFSS